MAFTISRRAFMTRTTVGSVAAAWLVDARRAHAGPQREDAPLRHRFITANGIRIHLAEQGQGPVILMCHGFPESWYSWRYQLPALAAAGFHAVAPDMRGYGQTDAPRDIDQYTMLHVVGDIIGIADALRTGPVVIVGHDFGATAAWTAALLRPDRFRGVIALSVPFRPRGSTLPTSAMPQTESAIFYQLYFQQPGVAEAELARDVRKTMRMLLPDCGHRTQQERAADVNAAVVEFLMSLSDNGGNGLKGDTEQRRN